MGGSMFFLIFIIVAIAAFFSWQNMRINPNTKGSANISLMVSLGALVAALSNCFTVIPAGSVGVVDFFGTVSDNTLKSGINFVNPLARIVKMSIKTQELKEVMDVPSKEGLTVQLEVSVLYHLNPEKAADVYKTVGEEYEGIIIEPQFRSVTRGVTASFEAKALYTSEREHLSKIILQEITAPQRSKPMCSSCSKADATAGTKPSKKSGSGSVMTRVLGRACWRNWPPADLGIL